MNGSRHGQPDFLSAERMQLFVAGLSGLAPEEVRKAKALYLRNAISEYRAMDEQFRAFGCIQLFFALIPIFWPFLYAQWRSIRAQRRLMRDRIENALEVWRDDLDRRDFDLDELWPEDSRRPRT